MPAKLTQNEFIKRSAEKHNNKYDYSKVIYKRKDDRVLIICPEHGEFEQIANNHMRGKGCAKCKPNHKLTQSEFVEKARRVHKDYYDYSKVNYIRNKDKVTIVCPDHGDFEQEANSHLRGSGCKLCGINRMILSSHNDSIQNERSVKRRLTCLRKYGVLNSMKLDHIKAKMKSTVLSKYGVENVASLDSIIEKRRATNLERYGETSYLKTNEGRTRLKDTLMRRYGVDNFTKSVEYGLMKSDVYTKYVATNVERYGAEHYSKSDEFLKHKDERLRKMYESKRKNGSFNTSSIEEKAYSMLLSKFNGDDVIRQYSDDRYPFNCDFYIKSLDLFIEINVSWTHGGAFYDKHNALHARQLSEWLKKSKSSDYYKTAIDVWTRRDLNKLYYVEKNELNYLVVWRSDLVELENWLDL